LGGSFKPFPCPTAKQADPETAPST
jgi:hypothetical protein